MKKLLLASAVAALSITVAQAAPQVYGKAFLTLDVQDGNSNSASKDSRTQLNSNASRIGFKGSEALTVNTDLVYQLEYGIDVDANEDQFYSRDTFLGLSNKQYGILLAGRLSAIDGMVDYANVTEGGVIGGNNVLAAIDSPRANNALAYVSPKYNGVNFLGMYVLDENNGTDTLARDAFGVGVQYEPTNTPYRAGVSYIQAGDLRAARVSGAYDLSPATTVGALYQNTKLVKGGEKENAFTVSAEHKLVQTPWTAYGQLDFVDNARGNKDAEIFRTVVGSKYAFNKATTGHLYGAYQRSEGVNLSNTATGNKANAYGVGAGLEYKF
ncbi:porin [Moraxella bovis]|uniref:Porin n=1 Tax=Moraxella bovis TaxID=476 RepID=A0AAQ2QBB0_MORBO|nr:porin [Moraxella bovis]AWY20916.1 porin [Moraxella bovis]UYZ76419.1 porin [Moraxella bovis]UYZ77629.1 porin [Moraxella bovis]UYZ81861.1 porin [Moraxella bovis]UYZ86115.1 porin [Moraxella bovis]